MARCRYFRVLAEQRRRRGLEQGVGRPATFLTCKLRFKRRRASRRLVEGWGVNRYTQEWRGGRAVECGGLENRYVGNPGVGGSNPPLSASRAGQPVSTPP